ncbi:MAG: protoporphyrinogen oxidase [Nitrospirae bacterium]|nr:MAG: protoporphyrinogen oxidase [Nitrospirota bacterium]
MTDVSEQAPKRVVIVGGGIAGLAAAFSLQEKAAEAGVPVACTVIEAGAEWGGKIATHRVGEFLIEAGPDSFLSQKPWALELCAKLGLSNQVVNTNELGQKASVYSRGRLRELPEGLVAVVPTKLGPFLRSGLVSWPGIVRMGMDLVLPGRFNAADESLASFFRRRLGREAFERVVEPLMAGIYAGDAEQMSLRATFPQFIEIERRHGSLIRGLLAGRKTAGASKGLSGRTPFVTLKDGMGELVRALVARVRGAGATLLSGRRVSALRAPSIRSKVWTYDVVLEDGAVLTADVVVLATPAYVAAEFLRPISLTVSKLLDGIPYTSTATVALAYGSNDLGPLVRGFGFIVPRVERRDLLAATWSSLKWPHRAPPAHMLARCYIGGVGREDILRADDATIVRRVRDDLRHIAGIAAEPVHVEVNRWERGMPQYVLGHRNRLDQIQAAMSGFQGLYFTGAAYRGVGVPDCIRDGNEAADLVVKYLTGRRI